MKTRKSLIAAAICVCLVITFASSAFACTTIIVGKDVSEDGSAYFGRTCDSWGVLNSMVVTVPAVDGEGTWKYTDENNKLVIELPVKAAQYFMSGSILDDAGYFGEAGQNEYGVCISATETLFGNPDALKADPYVTPGITETNIIQTVIPYVKTAREGVQRLGELVEKYGSSESNGVIIGDKNEIWYMEIYTGHQWAAVRCPDDKYAVMANDAIFGYLDLEDKDNCMASENIYSLAEKEGFLKEIDGKPNLAATYNRELRAYSQIRLWASRHVFNPSEAGEFDVSKRYDMFETPEKKISLSDLFEFTRYRYEDTKYSCDIPENNYRPVGIERISTTTFFQIRDNKPTVAWTAFANPEFSVYIPLYGNLNKTPHSVSSDVNSQTYNEDSLYWQIRTVSTLATIDREKYGSFARDTFKKMETYWINNLDKMDLEYRMAGSTPEKASEMFEENCKSVYDVCRELMAKQISALALDTSNESLKTGKDN